MRAVEVDAARVGPACTLGVEVAMVRQEAYDTERPSPDPIMGDAPGSAPPPRSRR